MSTKIEWTDETWNPVTGCTKVSEGCRNCYAERIAKRFPHDGSAPGNKTNPFEEVITHPGRLNQPLHWKKVRRIFVCSMGDLFHEDVPDKFLDDVFWKMEITVRHTFQVLTKRPKRMMDYLSSRWSFMQPPKNIWLGTSVEDQKTADDRIPLLLQIPAAVRFVSYEPALGPVDFRNVKMRMVGGEVVCIDALTSEWVPGEPSPTKNHLDWIIAGGESGPHARPTHPEWFRSVRDECFATEVPFFFKQWGEWVTENQSPEDIILPGESRTFPDGRGLQHFRVGKKRAGSLMDGREWKQFP